MEIKEKVISNTIYLFFDTISITIFSFLFWVLIGKTLSPENFGIITTSTVLITSFPVFILFGITAALTKLIPEYLEKRNNKKFLNLVKFSFKFTVLVNIIFVLISYILAFQISQLFKLPLDAFYLTIIGTLIYSLYTLTGSIVYGLQNMRKIFITNLIGNTFKVLISALFIAFGFSYGGPLLGFLIAYFIIFILRLEKKWFFSNSDRINKKEIFLKYGIPAFISGIVSLVFSSIQYFILPILTNQYETGLFGVANKITYLISVIPITLGAAAFPTVSGLAVYQKLKLVKIRQEKIINLALRYSLFLSLPLVLFATVFSKPLVLIVSSVEYINSSVLFLPLSLASLFFGISSILVSALYAIRKPEIMRNISVIVSITFLILAFILTINYSSLGMSYALLISMLVMFTLSFYYLKKFLQISIDIKSFLKIIFANFILLIIFLTIDFLPFDFFVKLFLTIFSLLGYATTLLFLKFYTKYDAEVLNYIAQKAPFLRREINYLLKKISKYI